MTRLVRGGAQRIALDIALALRGRGIEAPIWTGPLTGPEGSLHEEARAGGIPVRIFPDLVREVDPRRDLRALIALRRALREERPDWVHTHNSKAGILGREAARAAGVPRMAHTVHGWGFTPETPWALRRIYQILERRNARGGARLIFVNPADRLEGERLGLLPRGLGIDIPPGIDLAPYADPERLLAGRRRIREGLGLGDEVLLGGFLGRLAPQKDPAALLGVAGRLRPTLPELRWLVVGDGPLAPELRRRSQEDPSLRGLIHWAGLQSDPAPFLAAMDFLLLPSRWEGTPLTVMEAMAAGLPVIASDLPGTRLLLAPGNSSWSQAGTEAADAGLLAPPEDPDGFVTHVLRITSDDHLMQDLKARSRDRAFASFGKERMLARILEVYGLPEGEIRSGGSPG